MLFYLLCCKLIVPICMGLFLGSQFCSIDLCIFFCQYHAILITMAFFLIFFNFWLCWVFVSVWGLSLVVASGDHSSSRCAGLSLSRPLLWSTGSRRAGSVVVAHGPSCSAACGIFPDQGSNPCPPHWQADSQPLRHQGNPLWLWNIVWNQGVWYLQLYSFFLRIALAILLWFHIHFRIFCFTLVNNVFGTLMGIALNL